MIYQKTIGCFCFNLRVWPFSGARFGATFRSYRPDSLFFFSKYPESRSLLKGWLKNNRVNNAGDLVRFYSFILNINQILNEGVPGDFAEVGVWRGNSASVLAHYARTSGRRAFLFDTWEGFDPRDLKEEDGAKNRWFGDVNFESVKALVGQDPAIVYVKGYFPDSLTGAAIPELFSVVSLDCDLYEPTLAALTFFYPLMPAGGLFLLHDYSSGWWGGSKQAIDEFCRAHNEHPALVADKSGSAIVRKSSNSSNVFG